MATKKRKNSNGKLAAGLGATALAAAGATYYFYASKNAKKHRQAASRWTKGLRREAVKRAKSLKNIDARAIGAAVDEAAGLYENVRGISTQDLRAAAAELKREWKKVSTEAKGSAKRVGAKAKTGTKKVVRKAQGKKAAKKKRTSVKRS